MATPGVFGATPLGWTPYMQPFRNDGGPDSHNLNSTSNGVAFRFRADTTRDVKGVYVNWFSVSTPPTVRLGIETTDMATGKPSGTLYDGNATLDFTPNDGGTDGWQLLQFATLPTTGLTVGAWYQAVFVPQASAGNAQMRTRWTNTRMMGDAAELYASVTPGTRSNFAEIAYGTPVFTIVFEDDVEEACGASQYPFALGYDVYGTRAIAARLTVPSGVNWKLMGVQLDSILRTGTPDALRIRVLDSANATVKSVLWDKDLNASLTGSTGAGGRAIFNTPLTLTPESSPYRVLVEQRTDADAASATGNTNKWSVGYLQARVAALVPSGLALSTTNDSSVASPTWTDSTRAVPGIYPLISDVVAVGGGGGTTVNVFNIME